MFPPVGRTTTVFLSEPPDRVGRSQTGTTPMDDSTGPDSEYWDGADYLEHSVPPLGQVASLSAGFVLREDSPATEASASPTPALSAAEPKPMSAPETSSPELALEASNPFPPHMRGSRYHFRELPERSRTSVLDRAAQKTVCASCSKVVVNLRSSSPCPKCLRPVCGGCLREAFVTRGHGWCIDCFDSHEMVPTETAA